MKYSRNLKPKDDSVDDWKELCDTLILALRRANTDLEEAVDALKEQRKNHAHLFSVLERALKNVRGDEPTPEDVSWASAELMKLSSKR